MAGDWIKMRADLLTHPKVVRISSALKADRLRTVGGLMAVWCLFDAHSIDGKLDGYTLAALDDLIGWPGFATEMVMVGWLEFDEDSLTTPRFDEHNGQSAKRRATETQRKRTVRKLSASDADEMRSREEKRREEKKETSVAIATGAKAPPEEIVFAYGVPLLVSAGNAEKQARSFLGKLNKDHGAPAVVDALRDCIRAKPLQPLEWLAAALPPKGKSTNRQEAIEDRNRAVGDAWLKAQEAA